MFDDSKQKVDVSVNSGVFAALDDNISMSLDEYGFYRYKNLEKLNKANKQKLTEIDMMSDVSLDEDQLGMKLFSDIKNIKHDKNIGYYLDLYAGFVVEGSYRKNGSSGGLGTWVLQELLDRKEVDYVIHVRETGNKNNILFEYTISSEKTKVSKGAKSRYYPMQLADVLKTIKENPGKYAIVGIPEFINEIRLLSEHIPLYKERIKYTVGLVCGHQKSTKYVEMMLWQQGIDIKDVEKVNFRKKRDEGSAIEYLTEVKFKNPKNKKVAFTQQENFAGHWGHGFFKAPFSDYTDNAFNELADITLGDAWVEPYIQDPAGTNIVIVRNNKINELIKKATREGRLNLDKVDKMTIKKSQEGLIRHTQDELFYRINRLSKQGLKAPAKRKKFEKDVPKNRQRIQDVRLQLANDSHALYRKAKEMDDFDYFQIQIQPLIDKYNNAYERYYRYNNKSPLYYHLDEVRKKAKVRTRIKSIKPSLIKAKEDLHLRTRARRVVASYKNKKYDGLIVTLSGVYNYGNIMQKYALQKFLEDNKFKFNVLVLPHYYDQEEVIYKNTLKFQDKYIKTVVYNGININGYKNYIVGSDQVWKGWEGFWHFFSPYWLEFAEKDNTTNRISYAASFGANNLKEARIKDDYLEKIKLLINKFNSISVREDSGVKLANDLAGRDKEVEVVLDPTFLLNKEDYSKLIDDYYDKESFSLNTFSYILDMSMDKKNFIKKYSKNKIDNKIINPVEGEEMKPVEEWLGGFRDSDLVITDSFHGMVFSIINNTDFIVIANKERGLDRFTTVLERLNLMDRLLFEEDLKSNKTIEFKEIDWQKINNNLSYFKKRNGDWLLNRIK